MPYHYVFLALWLILVAYWIYGYFGNKRSVYVWRPCWRLAAMAAFVAFVVLCKELPAMNARVFRPAEPVVWIGIAVCAAGLAFAIWARRTLGRNWSGAATIKEGHELITRGPYRFVRHPIYTGLLTGVAGTLIGSGKVRELVILAAAALAIWAKLSVEERLMLRQFPEAYPEYRRRTKAIIPFVI
jgi:protein-S-isoprenylcysteine O-methyltransferase Ste14